MEEKCIKFPKSMTPEERDEIERIVNQLIEAYPDVYERNQEAIVYMGASLYNALKHEQEIIKESDDKWVTAAVKYAREKEQIALNKGINIGVVTGAFGTLLGMFLAVKFEKLFGRHRKRSNP